MTVVLMTPAPSFTSMAIMTANIRVIQDRNVRYALVLVSASSIIPGADSRTLPSLSSVVKSLLLSLTFDSRLPY